MANVTGIRIQVVGGAGSGEQLIFDRFPVRLGRSPLNEVQLDDSHVSQWHAIIGDVEGAVRLIDVGSRNGTRIGERRLTRGEAVPLRGGEQIAIGPFLLQVELLSGAISKEMRSQASAPVSRSSVPIGEATAAYAPSRIDAALGAEVAAAREADLSERLKPTYLSFLRAWATLCDTVRSEIKTFPSDKRDVVLARLRAEFPAHIWEEEFPQLAATPAVATDDAAQAALAGLQELATRLLRRSQPLGTAADVRAFVIRAGRVLEVFIDHTYNLLQGFQRLESDMAIKLMGRESSPIERARDARDLSGRLFDPAVGDDTKVAGWLASAFKNVMIQQVGLLSGAMEGIRTLLAHLSPQAIEEEARKSGSLSAFASRAARLWKLYVEKHQKLSEEDQETFEAIFGSNLARAYVDLAGAAD